MRAAAGMPVKGRKEAGIRLYAALQQKLKSVIKLAVKSALKG
jgi:hypothetical protein